MQQQPSLRTALPRIAVVGVGRLGALLGRAFDQAGYPVVACASRMSSRAEGLADELPWCRAYPTSSDAAALADWVFLTVPDDAITEVAASIEWQDRQLAVHCSGALPATAMRAATEASARVAGFHPLQSFADSATGLPNLPGSWIGIEADEATWPSLADLARAVGATPLRLIPETRAIYHLSSVIVSNFTVGLMSLATDLWGEIGIDRESAAAALLPLLAGTVRNIAGLGPTSALTGPAARGDAGTLARHLEALHGRDAEQDVYRSLTRLLIAVARRQGRLDPEQISALYGALGDTCPRMENPP